MDYQPLLNLKARKVVEETTCRWCNEEEEDITHALLHCKTVREVWSNQFPDFPTGTLNTTLLEIAMQVQYRGNPGDLEKLFLIAWGMWYRRNQMVHTAMVIIAMQAAENALTAYKSHLQAHETHGTMKVCRWVPPDQGILKRNVDGGVFANQRCAGVGIVLRYEKDDVILSACKKENEVIDPLEIEMVAILRGLQLCIPLGKPQLVIESDSLLMVNEIQNERPSISLHRNLVLQIKQLMQKFPNYSIQYSGRLGNGAAHGMARHAWNIDDLITLWGSYPHCIAQVIWTDSIL